MGNLAYTPPQGNSRMPSREIGPALEMEERTAVEVGHHSYVR